MKSLLCAQFGAAIVFGFFIGGAAFAETNAPAQTTVNAPVRTVAPEPVRVVSANPNGGPVTCLHAVWPNVPAECLKKTDGAAVPAKPVRVVGAQDDLRTNPEAAKDAGKPPQKLRRLPRQH